MADDWNFYLCQRDDAIASIMVNLGLRQVVPLADRPMCCSVQLQIRVPTDNGLSTGEERPVLNEIEDALNATTCSDCRALFVGRVISANKWRFVYYAKAIDNFKAAVAEVMNAFPAYSYACGAAEDPNWEVFRTTLLPNAREMQQILNRRVIDVLQRDGDDLRSSRTVRHWIYFQASFDRFRFAELARGQGFDVTESDLPDDGLRDRRFCCLVSRLDFVDDASINETVLLLFDNARACDGDYDGWETQVIKLGEPRA